MYINAGFESLIKRWNKVFCRICAEHLTINTDFSELEEKPEQYEIKNGITIYWLIKEVAEQLSHYYEQTNFINDSRYENREAYRKWVRETLMLQRLIKHLRTYEFDLIVASIKPFTEANKVKFLNKTLNKWSNVEYVTVELNGKEYTRKVYNDKNRLYIIINNTRFYEEDVDYGG